MLHALQSVVAQFIGHGTPTQSRVSMSCGHRSPFSFGGTRTARVRFSCPLPHTALHTPQLPQSCMAQCTGQSGGAGLQLRRSTSGGHASPPPACSIKILRCRDCVPTGGPHVCEHIDQSLQLPTWQCTEGVVVVVVVVVSGGAVVVGCTAAALRIHIAGLWLTEQAVRSLNF